MGVEKKGKLMQQCSTSLVIVKSTERLSVRIKKAERLKYYSVVFVCETENDDE